MGIKSFLSCSTFFSTEVTFLTKQRKLYSALSNLYVFNQNFNGGSTRCLSSAMYPPIPILAPFSDISGPPKDISLCTCAFAVRCLLIRYIIRITCLCDLYPLLYSKTGVYMGIHYFLIFSLKHRLWVLVRTASHIYHETILIL